MKTTSIILCGGKERRFGRNKALAIVAGRQIIDRVIERLTPFSSQVLVVTSQEKAGPDEMRLKGRAEVLTDKYPGKGPLGGIYSGLLAARTAPAIVVGCDMPFLNTRLLAHMLEIAGDFDAVVPKLDGGMIEPLHAVYAKTCLPMMKAHLDQDKLAITPLLARLNVRYLEKAEYEPLDPGMLSFFNINYPQDLERANEIARQVDFRVNIGSQKSNLKTTS